MNEQSQLMSFYFGSLSDEKRLSVEREMLTDPEVLLDYLDLKRKIEGARTVPQTPSPEVWRRLRSRVVLSKRARYSLVAGLGLAVALAMILFIYSKPRIETPTLQEGQKILFDSGHEQFGHANVL